MSTKLNLDWNWRFHLGDVADAGYMGYDDQAWRTVTLPHDWAVEHPFDKIHSSGTGYLPGGTGWYRKHFELDESIIGKCVRLCFQGIYKHAKIWINSNYLGQHAYGYTSFSFEVSEFIRPGENVIAVRVEHEEVADSRWYTGSGINRHVYLTISEPVCFAEYGIFVKNERADENIAVLNIQYATQGAEEVRFCLLDTDGSEAASTSAREEKGNATLSLSMPKLWSPEYPYLYTLIGKTYVNGQVTDREEIFVGVRVFRFDPDHGFSLNGVRRKLKGVCVHHDAGCLGAAVPKNVWARRLRKFKEMGCNAIRTAHNPPDPDLLDLCDELGFLVMDEAFDEWEGTKNKWWQGHNVYPPKHFGYAEDFPQWHEIDLTSMVLRDRNHPSVILWSIGNEIDYPNDPYVSPMLKEAVGNNDADKPLSERQYDVRKPDVGRLTSVAKKLVDIVHSLDDSRPVTSALSFPEISNYTGYADVLDLSGYNYREHFYEGDHRSYPDRVIIGSENSHDPKAWWAVVNHDFISGQFLWTGVDFLGECPGWPIRISRSGTLNLAGFEKPLFYQRKALWTKAYFVRIAVGDGAERHQDARDERFHWEGKNGQNMIVSCYTNAGEVELFLNDESLGKKTLTVEDGCRVCWEVKYQPGTLRAVVDGAEDSLSTAQPASEIRLCADKKGLAANGLDTAQVEIYLIDEEGKPAQDEIVCCQILGDAVLLGIENGSPEDLTPYADPARSTLDGRCIAYVRAGTIKGNAVLHVWTASGHKAETKFILR